MTGILNHTPAQVVRQAIIDLVLGTEPSDGLAWPVHDSALGDEPDDALCVFDTEGRQHGRYQTSGTTPEHYGFSLMSRSLNIVDGYVKLKRIMEAFDTQINRTEVTLAADASAGIYETLYRINSISRTGAVRRAGRDGRRWLHAINFLVSLELVSELGTGI